jgi:hypothetical protein
MTNKYLERFATLVLQMPAGINFATGVVVLLGRGTHVMSGVTATAQNTTNPVYDSNSGYITVDFEGAFNLSVEAQTQGSPSAGAAINIGDAVYADGGTYDKTTGITYGSKLSADSTGTFVGIALQPIAAGLTATIPVLLKNAA